MQPLDGFPLRQVAEQDHGAVVKLVGHNVEVAILVEIEDRRRPRPQGTPHFDRLGKIVGAHQGVIPVLPRGIEHKPRLGGAPAATRLHPQDEFAILKSHPAVVEEETVHAVTEWEVHAGGDEDIHEAVRVQISRTQSPRPVVLRADLVGNLFEFPPSRAPEERVAVDAHATTAQHLFVPEHFAFQFFAVGADFLAHVGVHVGDVDILVTVVVEVEDLDPHRAPRGLWENLAALHYELLPAHVLIELIVALHGEHIEVGPAVLVVVEGGRIAGPALIEQSHLPGDVHECVPAFIVVENAALAPPFPGVSLEGVAQTDAVAAFPPLIGGVDPDVAKEEIEQSVLVVIEEHSTRGVPHVTQARRPGPVRETPRPVILEEVIAPPHGGGEKVGVAIVVGVREGSGHSDPVRQRDGGRGDVAKLSPAQVAPQLVRTNLGGEVDVEQSVAIHIGHRDPVSVIVVHRLVVLAGVVHNPVQESNPARLHLVTELEVVKSADAPRPRHLQLLPALHPGRRNDLLRERKLLVAYFRLPHSRRDGLGQDFLQIGSEPGQSLLVQSVIRSPQPPDAIDQGKFRTVQDGHLAVPGILGHFKLKTIRTEVPEIPPRSC